MDFPCLGGLLPELLAVAVAAAGLLACCGPNGKGKGKGDKRK